MPLKTRPFDPLEFLRTDEDLAAYLDEALATDDAEFINHALGTVARAKGIAEIARRSGLSHEDLHRALSADGNPEFATVVAVLKALGFRLSASPIVESEAA